MGAIERLTRDHRLLYPKLDMLQGAVAVVPESWWCLREGCFAVSRLLQDHTEREARIMTAHRAGLERAARVRAIAIADHHARLQSFGILSRYFLGDTPRTAEEDVCRALSAAVEGLRDELHAQEEDIFPVLERLTEDRERVHPASQALEPLLSGELTVNRVINQHPETKPVFDRFVINVSYEGYDSLDEVAWRRGALGQALLQCLEETIVGHAVYAGRQRNLAGIGGNGPVSV